MWHVETFDSQGEPGEMEALLAERLLPWFRSRGFAVHAFVTQASLGERQFWLATEMASFADIDDWAERGGEEGAAIIRDVLKLAVGIRASVIAEIGPHPLPPAPSAEGAGERWPGAQFRDDPLSRRHAPLAQRTGRGVGGEG